VPDGHAEKKTGDSLMNNEQIDLFGAPVETTKGKPTKKAAIRDVNAEAKQILQKSGISAMPKEAKEYVLAELIAQFFPELKNVMTMSLIFWINNTKTQNGKNKNKTYKND
jgi:hypothetical protein